MTAPTATKNAPPPRPYPFAVGVYESTTQDYDETKALGATIAAWTAGIQLPKWNISPTGWFRTAWLDFTCTVASNSASVTAAENGPFSCIQKCTFADLGGQVVQQYTGYELMLVNKYGGYYMMGDPRGDITYSFTTGTGGSGGSFHFILGIPLEVVARTSLGTVQNESKPGWSIEIYLDSAANTYGTAPTSTGTASLRVKGYTESYTEPAGAATNGRPFSQTPPVPGTLQYWGSENQSLASGNAKFDLSNGIGFPIRNILYYGEVSGSRSTFDGDFPDPATIMVGNVTLRNISKNLWNSRLGKDFNLSSTSTDVVNGRENGVYPVYFDRDFGLHPGAELGFKYLNTLVNTVVRFQGSFGAASTFYALTNWLSVPSNNRYSLISGGN